MLQSLRIPRRKEDTQGRTKLKPLISAMKAPGFGYRYCAAESLGEIADPPAVEPLIACLQSNDEYLQREAARALGKIKDPRPVGLLIAIVGNGLLNIYFRGAAAEALGEIGDPRAVEPLIQALGTSEANILKSTIKSLGELKDPRAIEPLIALLRRPYKLAPLLSGEELKKLLTTAMEEFGPLAVAPLCAALKDPNKEVRRGAVTILDKLKYPAAFESISAALNVKDSLVRLTAVQALGASGDSRAAEPLIAALQNPTFSYRWEVIRGWERSKTRARLSL